MEHDAFVFRICRSRIHGQAVDRAAGRCGSQTLLLLAYTRKHGHDFIEERRADLDELMSVLQRGDRLGVQRCGRNPLAEAGDEVALLAARSVAGCSPRSSAT